MVHKSGTLGRQGRSGPLSRPPQGLCPGSAIAKATGSSGFPHTCCLPTSCCISLSLYQLLISAPKRGFPLERGAPVVSRRVTPGPFSQHPALQVWSEPCRLSPRLSCPWTTGTQPGAGSVADAGWDCVLTPVSATEPAHQQGVTGGCGREQPSEECEQDLEPRAEG